MNIVVLGYGRLGKLMVEKMEKSGVNTITVIDKNIDALNALDRGSNIEVLKADGTNMGIYDSIFNKAQVDIFLALTNADNTNIMAAEIAKAKFNVPKTIARVQDPKRAKAFEELGIETLCPTTLSEKALLKMLPADVVKAPKDKEK